MIVIATSADGVPRLLCRVTDHDWELLPRRKDLAGFPVLWRLSRDGVVEVWPRASENIDVRVYQDYSDDREAQALEQLRRRQIVEESMRERA